MFGIPRRSHLVFLVLLAGWALWFSPVGFGDETPSPNATSPSVSGNGWSRDKVAQMLGAAITEAEMARQAETHENARLLSVDTNALQQRTRKWLELKAILSELDIEFERQSVLSHELDSARQATPQVNANNTAQEPSYTIDRYDQLAAERDALQQTAKTTGLALETARQDIEQARERLQENQREWRQLQEQFEGNRNPVAQWRLQGATLENQISEARYQLVRLHQDNLKTEQQIITARVQGLRDQASWVKERLKYSEADWTRHEQTLKAKREELEKNLAKLAARKKEADQNWLKAQAEAQKTASSELIDANPKKLKGAERWRKAYQTAMDQTMEMIRLIEQQHTAWQKRYSLLKNQIDRTTLANWNEESGQRLQALERQLFIEQQRQNDLWRQINTAENLSAGQVVQDANQSEVKALQYMAAFGMDYLTLVSATQSLERRLKDEIEDKLEDVPFRYRLEKVWSSVKAAWNYELWVIDDRPLTVKKVLVALVILIIGILVTKILIRRMAEKVLRRPQVKASTAAAIEKLLLYVSYLLVVLFALRMVNIPLTAFAFFGGAIAIGIGFGAQNLINNFISGFIIMGEQPIRIGDLIEVDGLLGVVEEVGARSTRIRTGENIHILVPNSSFLEKNITNWTHSDRRIRAHVTIGVVYGSPVDQVRDLLLQVCREFDAIHTTPEPFVLFTDFGDNALIFEVHFWITVQRVVERRMIESRMRFRIDTLFREADIVIAFPQRDVHLDTTKPLQIKMLDAENEK